TLLGAVAYILIRQGDAPGLSVLEDRVVDQLPSRTKPTHLDEVLAKLAAPATPGTPTGLLPALTELAERAGRRGLIALASDLLDFDDRALDPLSYLTGRGHDVVVFHVLDPDELELPFHDAARFVGLEGETPIDADPDALREAYLEEVERFLTERRTRCAAAGARYVLARTDEPVERTLASVLTTSRRKGFA
ncbi:MAG: hypothetical protein AB7P00_33970, partial [Sandaracinaceae bacterium]